MATWPRVCHVSVSSVGGCHINVSTAAVPDILLARPHSHGAAYRGAEETE